MSDSTVQEPQDAPAKHSRPLVENMWSPVLLLIRFYQKFISPMLGQNCRFTPSCSQYMVEAITEHGHAKGAYLGTKRICKCHPWNEGGYDPVPKKQQKTV